MEERFDLFMGTVDECFRDLVSQIHDYLTEQGCDCEIKTAKSGHVVSYIRGKPQRTLATFVSRKTGMKLRIFPEHIHEYQSFLDDLPETMKKDIKKASVCKRLVDPDACNPRCVMGYTFEMDGERYQKCRYMAFMPTLSMENDPYIKLFLKKELECGQA